MTSSKSFVKFDKVDKSYDGKVLVVKDLNLDINEGEFITMLGPSGSGKTTCLMMLAGFETPTNGEIYFSGLTTGQKMTREIETMSRSYETKVECERDLNKLKGNKNSKEVNSFNGEKSLIITDTQPLVNKERLVVNAFQCLEVSP